MTRDPATGQILLDGVPLDSRDFQLPPLTPRTARRGRRGPRSKTAAVVDELDDDET